MGDLNSKHNRFVWVDIPVADLDRAAAFYSAVLGVKVFKETFGDVSQGSFSFGVIEHENGNGGCLIPCPNEVCTKGPTVYLNVDGRIHAATAAAVEHGGKVLEPVHAIGPHGFRAVVLDSEGNRIALHSNKDI